MAAVQRTYSRAKGDSAVGGSYEQNRATTEPGQDPEATELGEEEQGIHGLVSVQVLAPGQHLFLVHLVHYEPGLLRTHPEYECARGKYIRKLGE